MLGERHLDYSSSPTKSPPPFLLNSMAAVSNQGCEVCAFAIIVSSQFFDIYFKKSILTPPMAGAVYILHSGMIYGHALVPGFLSFAPNVRCPPDGFTLQFWGTTRYWTVGVASCWTSCYHEGAQTTLLP